MPALSERAIREINSGIYAFDLGGLFEAVHGIAADNAQREYYLPDLVQIYRERGRIVEALTVANPQEVAGINSRSELAAVNRLMREDKNRQLMAEGVTIEDPATTYIDPDVQVGADTVIHPGVVLEGRTIVGSGCEIHSWVRLVDATIGDGATILNHCVLTDVTLGSGSTRRTVRPSAQPHDDRRGREGGQLRRDEEDLAGRTHEGDAPFVSGRRGDWFRRQHRRGDDHLQLRRREEVDDHDRGRRVHRQRLAADRAGHLGGGAYVGTGTTIRENVPAGALAVSAGKQRNIEEWVAKRKKSKP